MIPSPDDVLNLVCKTLGVDREYFVRRLRRPEIARAKYIWAGLCRSWTGSGYEDMCKAVGRRTDNRALIGWVHKYVDLTVSGSDPEFIRDLYAVRDRIAQTNWERHPFPGGYPRPKEAVR